MNVFIYPAANRDAKCIRRDQAFDIHSRGSLSSVRSQKKEPEAEYEKTQDLPGFCVLGSAVENPNEYRRRDSNPHECYLTGF